MTIETESIPSEAYAPSPPQLDKIVESLNLLITMHVERDQREIQASASLEAQLRSLQDKVDRLQANFVREGEFPAPKAQAESNSRNSILAEYGLLEDNESVQDASDRNSSETADQPKACDESNDSALLVSESVSGDSELPINEKDSDEIESLKAELRRKLRDAEVELSINRANMMQRQAEIEEREAQLRRAQRLNQDNAGDDDLDTKIPQGILARLKKHLRQAGLANKNELLSLDSESEEITADPS